MTEDALTRPYPGYIERLIQQLAADAAKVESPRSAHKGAPADLRAQVSGAVEALADDLVGLSHDIHAHPELGYAEHHAVRAVATLLAGHGHDAQVGAYGLDTALRARAGAGRPRVAILAEYDALPGIGHACGHNVICATAVGAFLATATVVADLGGSVELIGCPAEEGGGGKELIARAGGFDEIDAAIMVHPSGFEAAENLWIGVRTVEVVYHGLAAHASAMPFLGRNALDAVVQAYTSLAALRQHILPTDRIHGIITDGGQKPNIVPERAAALFYLRSAEPETLIELSDRARAVFEAAAGATGTRAEIGWDPTPTYFPVRSNHALVARWATNIAERGRRALPRDVIPMVFTASTDLGNVSIRVPAIHPLLAIAPPQIAVHSAEFTEWARSDRGDVGCIDGGIGLALTAVDYLTDAALREAVRAEFEAAGGRLDVDALLG